MAEQSKPYEPTPFEEGCEKLFQQRKRDRAAGKIQEASRRIVIGHEEAAVQLEQRVELDEAAKGAKSFAGYPGRCKTCGAVVKKSATKEADPINESSSSVPFHKKMESLPFCPKCIPLVESGRKTNRVDLCQSCSAMVRESIGRPLGDGWMEKTNSTFDSRRPARKTVDIDRAKLALKESFLALGLGEEAANIAAGLDEGTFAGVPISDLLKG
jgi:hypothetical protein